MKLCLCGCNKFVTKEGNNWINHHCRGWCMSQESKDKIGKDNSLELDEEYIKKAFTEQDKTTIEIGKELNTGDGVILRRLKKMGVNTKHKFTKRGLEIVSQNLRKYLKDNGSPMKDINVRIKVGKKIKEHWADKDYKSRVSKKISLSMQNNPKTHWKKTDETKKKMSISRKLYLQNNPEKVILSEQKRYKTFMDKGLANLEKNSQWKGGISYEPYSENWNKRLKNLIRKRDNQICMNCGIHREKLNESLNVHHINYDKKLSIPENLICLCRKCHSLTTINRSYWTKLFQDKLSKLYGYKYSENETIIFDILMKGGNENGRNIN